MKRIIAISLTLIALALGAFAFVPLSERAACFENGTVPNSMAQAASQIGRWLHHTGKGEWSAMGVSEQDLLGEINVVEVNGPAMTFEHHSTRYVKFELSNCPTITMPITVAVHCGDTPNLGWVAKSCLSREN